MCGIVGYIGSQEAAPIVMEGLRRLEYRGYDSSGIAVISGKKVIIRKKVGKLKELSASLEKESIHGTCGFAHTRWATHGQPTQTNAHPHVDCHDQIIIIHNGIIENFQALKTQLEKEGHTFRTQTDTEVVAHLIEKYYKGNIENAVREALQKVEGAYALVIMCVNEPDKLVGARCGPPLIVGLGKGENFLGSDVPAVLKHTREVIYLEDNEVAVLTRDKVVVTDLQGNTKNKKVHHIEWDLSAAEKGGYPHFMLKEIHDQPKAISDTLLGRISKDFSHVKLDDEIKMTESELKAIKKIVIIACGTAYHASMIGRYLLEQFVRIPVEVDLSSEFRYRDPLIDEHTLVIPITQSGETADTLAGLREAKRRGGKIISICNVVGSSIARESDEVIYTHAGPEIGVCSTKAYSAQITVLYLFTLYLGRVLGKINPELKKK